MDATPSERLGSRLSQEEEQAPPACAPSECAVGESVSPATVSSASETGSVPTRGDLAKVETRLVRMTDHLRDELADTKTAWAT